MKVSSSCQPIVDILAEQPVDAFNAIESRSQSGRVNDTRIWERQSREEPDAVAVAEEREQPKQVAQESDHRAVSVSGSDSTD